MTPSSDSLEALEREARNDEAAHMHRCEKEEGGPVCELRKDMRAMGEKVDRVMFRQATWNGGFMVLQIIGMAVFGAWLSSRFSQPQQHATTPTPSLINQAHAAPKGTP